MFFNLNPHWKPYAGEIVTWYAMDKFGKLAKMTNNGYGELPDCLLATENVENMLRDLGDFLYEEESEFIGFDKFRVNGDFILDLYSSWFFRFKETRHDVELYLKENWSKLKNISDVNICGGKGIYLYEALNQDDLPNERPIGYNGDVASGDYYRHLIPTLFASIENMPKPLRKIIAVSDTLDFSEVNLIKNYHIKKYFTNCFIEK